MARTRKADPAKMDLAELEELHEAANERRGELVAERKRLEAEDTGGGAVARELRRVGRQLDELEAHADEYMPHLQDARRIQTRKVRRAADIDRLEREIADLEQVEAFHQVLERAVRDHLVPVLTTSGRIRHSAGLGLDRYGKLARDVLSGQLQLDGQSWTVPAQLRIHLDQCRRRLSELRQETADG